MILSQKFFFPTLLLNMVQQMWHIRYVFCWMAVAPIFKFWNIQCLLLSSVINIILFFAETLILYSYRKDIMQRRKNDDFLQCCMSERRKKNKFTFFLNKKLMHFHSNNVLRLHIITMDIVHLYSIFIEFISIWIVKYYC